MSESVLGNDCDWQSVSHGGQQEEDEPSITITINNVVTLFNCRCHLNLKHLARNSINVEFKPDNNMVVMRVKKPYVVASIWSSGKVWCTGATSAEMALKGGRRVARRIMRCGYPCKFSNFRIVNILATCEVPFGIKLSDMVTANPRSSIYEPELHPALTYTIPSPKASLRVFSTGSIVITGPTLENIGAAVEHIYPLVFVHKMANRTELDRSQYADSVRRMKSKRNINSSSSSSHWSRQTVTGGGSAKFARLTAYEGGGGSSMDRSPTDEEEVEKRGEESDSDSDA